MPDDAVIAGRILEWGNSYGIRLKKSDLERTGLAPGADVVVHLERRLQRVDLSGFPFIQGGAPDDAQRHDEVLANARQAELTRKVRTDDAGR